MSGSEVSDYDEEASGGSEDDKEEEDVDEEGMKSSYSVLICVASSPGILCTSPAAGERLVEISASFRSLVI